MRRLALITFVLSAALLSACEFKFGEKTTPNPDNKATPSSPVSSAPLPRISGLPDFTQLVEKEGPAVVNISIKQSRAAGKPAMRGIPEDDPLYEFFRRFAPPEQNPKNEPVQSLGSGFIISADGVVLTNAHVVDHADEVTVRLTDKREFKAKVLGVDKRTDVAVLKIPGKDLPTVNLGDSNAIKQGEWVVAIGSPFGFDNTVTAGIVSAKGRSLPDANYVPFIQTDVAINPGNSGGPLFNLSGEVIGINSQIYSRTGGYMGLSFAIPIDVALKVADQLQKHGKVHRGRLGVQIQEISPELASSFGLKNTKGALVSIVDRDSPADKAGIKPGDVIIAFNDQAVESSRELPMLVGNSQPGTKSTLKIIRQGETREIEITLGEMASDNALAAEPASKSPVQKNKFGLEMENLSPEEKESLGLNQGVKIVEAEGPSSQAGLQAEDILLAINSQPVRSAQEATVLLNRSAGAIALLIRREDQTLFVPMTVPR